MLNKRRSTLSNNIYWIVKITKFVDNCKSFCSKLNWKFFPRKHKSWREQNTYGTRLQKYLRANSKRGQVKQIWWFVCVPNLMCQEYPDCTRCTYASYFTRVEGDNGFSVKSFIALPSIQRTAYWSKHDLTLISNHLENALSSHEISLQ